LDINNDTISIFDRIRENLMMRREKLSDIGKPQH